MAPISSGVTPELARQHTTVMTEPDSLLLLNPALYPAGTGQSSKDYPQLMRGQDFENALNREQQLQEIARLMPVFLPVRDQAELFTNIRRLFTRVGYRQQLQALHPELPQRLQAFHESAQSWRRRRYRAWRRFLPGLLQGWWSFGDLALALQYDDGNETPHTGVAAGHESLRAVVLAQQPKNKPEAVKAAQHLRAKPTQPTLIQPNVAAPIIQD